jgi:hypothetical protein
MQAISNGASAFGEIFQYTTQQEERIYCGDSSAALYLDRLSRGKTPLVSVADEKFSLTEAGRSVLRGDEDWITLGGSDRWLGGMHLEGANARWRWDAANRRTVESR